MADRIDVLQVGPVWRVFVNGGLVTQGPHWRETARDFDTCIDAWNWLSGIKQQFERQSGQVLYWPIPQEAQ
jgi:hypothetical protein